MALTSEKLSVEEIYLDTTPGSRALFERALAVMPGGTTRTSIFIEPYPLYIERGQGCRIWDVDGTERLDFICNYAAMILGHAHPAVVAAVQSQMERGTSFAAANPLEVELAELLCDRVPSLERVRFTNSGTEATMLAMRVARAFTGRSKIARIEGGYHGSHDFAQVSSHPDLRWAGPADDPVPLHDSAGVPDAVLDAAVVLRFNDLEGAERILTRHRNEVAAVILEPVMGSGGCIPAEPAYLEGLRNLTRDLGMLLIFDEVISFRVAAGGAQELYGVTPDLTTLGKMVGGGLPIGAFGGSAEVMDVLDPRRPRPMPHAGSFNGNPLVMTSGLTALRHLTPAVYEQLNSNGAWLRDRLQEVIEQSGVPGRVTGIASLFKVHFTDEPIRDHRDSCRSTPEDLRQFVLGLMNHGVLLNQHCMGALSTPVGRPELEEFVEASRAVLAEGPFRRSDG